MGITIHYRGRLNDLAQIDALSAELADIAAAMGWKSTRLDDDWAQPADARLLHTPKGAEIQGHLGLKGIALSPGPNIETLNFYFDREGNLRSPFGVVFLLDGTMDPEQAWLSTKTQFGPPEVHAWIVGLLKYLKKRYIADLEVHDDGEYWETGDINILRQRMDAINRAMDRLSEALSASGIGEVTDLDPEEIVAEIERILLGIKDREGRTGGRTLTLKSIAGVKGARSRRVALRSRRLPHLPELRPVQPGIQSLPAPAVPRASPSPRSGPPPAPGSGPLPAPWRAGGR